MGIYRPHCHTNGLSRSSQLRAHDGCRRSPRRFSSSAILLFALSQATSEIRHAKTQFHSTQHRAQPTLFRGVAQSSAELAHRSRTRLLCQSPLHRTRHLGFLERTLQCALAHRPFPHPSHVSLFLANVGVRHRRHPESNHRQNHIPLVSARSRRQCATRHLWSGCQDSHDHGAHHPSLPLRL